MGTDQKNFMQDMMLARFMGQIQAKLDMMRDLTDPGVGGRFHKSYGYIPPADWYNHRSKTFLKNKRRGL